MSTVRTRLPNRRPAVTEALSVSGLVFQASVGFCPKSGLPRELFLSGAKDGSMLAALLDDAAVVISLGLQHDLPAEALAKSVGRLPASPIAPADLDKTPDHQVSASPIGAALDLLCRLGQGD
jgi:ribonucleoside-diphosphate reductase alpha chain